MGKSDFISGSIFEFKVPKKIGYAYCKIIDIRNIREIDGVLAKVYDCIVEKPIKDISILDKKDWLFGARKLYDLPNSRGKGAWKYRGVLIADDDNIIPHFRTSPKSSPLNEDDSVISEWYVVKNLTEMSDTPCTFESVRHLENTTLGSTIGIEIRTAMEYYRINNLDIRKDFDLDDMANWNNYRSMINVPIYGTILKEIRGKALC